MKIRPEWFEMIGRRISRRRYDRRGVPIRIRDQLAAICSPCTLAGTPRSPQVLPGQVPALARVCLVDDPEHRLFSGIVGGYGRVTGTPLAAVMIGQGPASGPVPDDVQASVGYLGEALILEATWLGLGTCWIAGSFDAASATELVEMEPGERAIAVTPLGYATERQSGSEFVLRTMVRASVRLSVEKLAPGLLNGDWPAWAIAAVQAARLAPSGGNRQPWRFRMEGGALVMTRAEKLYWTAPIDFGIARLHVELGALHEGVTVSWTPLPVPDVAEFTPCPNGDGVAARALRVSERRGTMVNAAREPVAVVGAGLTGASWAGLFAAAGLEVRLHDVDGERLGAAAERAAAAARFLAVNELADVDAVEHGVARLTATADLAEAVADVTHVQECVREDLALKRDVFAAVDAAAPPDALVCTSSSGLSISDMQMAAAHPERCLAAHPYNPPHLVPLVELAPGALTAPQALKRAFVFFTAVGKEPVKLTRDLPGYLANRLSAALWREAVDLVLRGVATVEDVDKAVSAGPGLRWAAMGPHLLYDLGGGAGGIADHMKHLAAVKEGMLRDLAAWTQFPPETAAALSAGLAEEKRARTYDELVAERDALLVAYLRARRARAG